MKSPFTYKHTAPNGNGEKMPAIFLLHGMGSNEEDLLQLVQEFGNSHHIFSLRGPITYKPGYAFFTTTEHDEPTREVFDKVILYIQSFIFEAIEEYELDPNHLYIVGFSQGAVLAQSLALIMGSMMNKVVALSGYLPDFVKEEYKKLPVGHLHIFISHGDYDYVISPQLAIESKDYFETQGAKVTFKTYRDGHGVTPENQLDLVTFLKDE